MFVLPSGPSKKDMKALKFNIDDFRIFAGEGGVLREKVLSSRTVRTEISNRFRDQDPEVGDKVGIFTNLHLLAFQIESVGIVIAKRGSKSNRKYDIYVLDSDPQQWQMRSIDYQLVERNQPISVGLHKDVYGDKVVDAITDSYFTISPEIQNEIDRLILESKPKRGRKRNVDELKS